MATEQLQAQQAAEPGRSTAAAAGSFLVEHIFLLIFFLVVGIASFLSPSFLTLTNVINLFQQAAVVGIAALGMSYVILTGNIDLSVGSTAALSGVLVALLMTHGWAPAPAILATLLVAASAGALMGVITAFAGVPSFIATLAGLTSLRGVTYLLSQGVPIGNLPPGFNWIGAARLPLTQDQGMPLMAVLFVALAVVAGLVLRFTVFGEYVYATGGNAEAARLSGLPTRRIVTLVFAISSLLAGVGGILGAARLRVGQPTASQGMELDAIAAVVLGGASLSGGRGGIVGTFFAVMLLQVLRNIFNLLGLGSFYQMTITGIILIAAILLNRLIDHRMGRD